MIIGIDPDNKKSGVALVANTTREVKVKPKGGGNAK